MKRKSKAFIAAFLSVCLIATTVLVSTGNAFASDANVGELAVTSAQGYEGDTVKVTVSYNNNQGTAGFEFRMYYDPDVLELVKTTLSEDVFIEDVVILGDKNANEKMTNFVSYAVAMAKDNKKSGELYTVEFKIKDGAAIGNTELKITDLVPSNFNGDLITVNSKNSYVKVLCKHADTEEVVKEAVTCTKNGVTEVKCKKCGELIDTKTVKSTGHKFGEYEVVTEATCSKDGLKRRTCSVCNEVEEVKIPATGKHTAVTEITKKATCTTAGEKVTKCSVCDKVLSTEEIPATGHKFGEYKVVTEATCSKDGLKRRTCSVCNEVEEVKIPATGKHTAVTEITKKATCTTAGEKVTKCSVCDKVLSTEEIPATGHKYSDYVIKKDATETEDGILERTCTVCGETEKVTIPKLESLKTEVKDEKAENPLASQYTKGEDITFTAIGIGMDNVNPQAGDMRYVPAKWSINPSGEWTSAPYTATFAVANAGDYELKVVYNREVYKDGKWVADGVTITSKTAITIAEKAETPDNGNNGNTNNDSTTPSGDASTDNNASVSTGDTSIYVMIMAVIMMMASAAVIVEKSRKAAK
ncbi:MAG: cohesin domain-containing protein [Lachnospira sp.]